MKILNIYHLPSGHAAVVGKTPITRKVVEPTRLDIVQYTFPEFSTAYK